MVCWNSLPRWQARQPRYGTTASATFHLRAERFHKMSTASQSINDMERHTSEKGSEPIREQSCAQSDSLKKQREQAMNEPKPALMRRMRH